MLVQGGTKTNEKDLLQEIQQCLEAGVSGFAIGRNIWQSDNPVVLAKKIANMLRSFDVEVVGFGEAPIKMIAKKHRFDILVRSPSAKKLLDAIRAVDDKSFEADIDPISFS